jgi:hypothetical protein
MTSRVWSNSSTLTLLGRFGSSGGLPRSTGGLLSIGISWCRVAVIYRNVCHGSSGGFPKFAAGLHMYRADLEGQQLRICHLAEAGS